MTDFEIVRIEEKHLADIAAIEELCFSHPWSAAALKTLVSDRGVGFAALDKESGRVVSYAGAVMSDYEGDVTDVATHPMFRRKGLSRGVMERLIKFVSEKGIEMLALEVRVSNDAAISLYRGLGFSIEGKRPKFYRSPTEDAYVMIKHF
ncbi:MAG: ribosomal protein S18-alanine N-acetyltransferase [Clostridia bacterium]|nr:ribosomal protein S18-alanine N-acetyltransferase [Clostridia bacterium]